MEIFTALVLLYFGGAVVLGAIPVNSDFRQSAEGIDICVRANTTHGDLLLPAANAVIDWRMQHPPEHFPLFRGNYDFFAFGWGNRGHYIESATRGRPTSGTPLIALSGLGTAALHVEAVPRPTSGSDTVCTRVSQEQYRTLAAYIESSFLRDENGAVQRIDTPGYGTSDAFYEAKGAFSIFVTCNEWLARGLRTSGIRAPAWSPFDRALLRQLRNAERE